MRRTRSHIFILLLFFYGLVEIAIAFARILWAAIRLPFALARVYRLRRRPSPKP